MFVGHGFLAFAIAATLAHAVGWPAKRALTVGLLAGAFGLAPDVDMAYALAGLAGTDSIMEAAGSFWTASTEVHRVVTHSFVIGTAAAVAAGLLVADRRRYRAGGAAGLLALVPVAFVVSGPLGGFVMSVFILAVAGLALAGRRASLSPRAVAGAAAVGFLSHPPGDLLTGEPPAFLYPFDIVLVATRPTLTADPTLNLLAPLFIELLTFWLALAVYLHVSDQWGFPAVGQLLRGRAALGLGFAGFAALAPAPTLDVSYHFVFPLLGVGIAAAAPVPAVEVSSVNDLRAQILPLAVTGLTAVTLAATAYTAAYLVV